MDFNNTEIAFRFKTTSELRQALWMFRLLNMPVIGSVGKGFLKLAVKNGLPVKGAIRATLYKQFVGGETLEKCLPLMEKLSGFGVKSILDFSEEGKTSEVETEQAFQELKRNIEFAGAHREIPFTVFKPTAFSDEEILEKAGKNHPMNDHETMAWEKIQERFFALCDTAANLNVKIMIDAEDSWIQDAIDGMAWKMIEKHNKGKIIVINTAQLYRHDRLAFIKKCHLEAKEKGLMLGFKLVRGAYMEKERLRATEKNYPDPIQKDKISTDRDYDAAVEYCINNHNEILCYIGSHNEQSCQIGIDMMTKYNLPNNDNQVWFSQLLGMSDNLSFNLANEGYNVAKYVPYGPVRSVTPYLIRRADENTSTKGQTNRELAMISKELKRRG